MKAKDLHNKKVFVVNQYTVDPSNEDIYSLVGHYGKFHVVSEDEKGDVLGYETIVDALVPMETYQAEIKNEKEKETLIKYFIVNPDRLILNNKNPPAS